MDHSLLKGSGFSIIWEKRIPGESFEAAGHLFVLIRKSAK
jgi:hypothetical protein